MKPEDFFFEKINKIDKLLARMIREKKKKKSGNKHKRSISGRREVTSVQNP